MKTAYMIDGGFFIKKFQDTFGRQKILSAKYVCDFVRSFNTIHNNNDEIHRVFYYDCKPFDGVRASPVTKSTVNFKNTPLYHQRIALIDGLRFSDRVSVRLGTLSYRGWALKMKAIKRGPPYTDSDYAPNLEQKGVDIKIGLDMTWTSVSKNAEKIVLFTADSDFVSVMKFARIQGLQVTLCPFGHGVHDRLREHSDFFINNDMASILACP